MTDTPKYYGYVYEIIIPTSNGKKHYYGKKEYDHRCKKCTGIYETYWGSGIIIKDWFLAHTNNNYNSRYCPETIALNLGVERIIHGFYITKEELNNAEKELVQQHLGKEYCINLASGGTGGNTHHYVYTEEMRQNSSIKQKGMLVWNNGVINKRCKECPGTDWKLGMLLSDSTKKSQSIRMSKIMKNKKFSKKHKESLSIAHCKKIKCIELNLIFKSILEASFYLNGTRGSTTNISAACRNNTKTWRGYHWEFVDD